VRTKVRFTFPAARYKIGTYTMSDEKKASGFASGFAPPIRVNLVRTVSTKRTGGPARTGGTQQRDERCC
jgi:predicted RNA methylase